MSPYEDSSLPPTLGESTREYILDMIGDLATMARQTNELEIAIHLTAIREAARVAKRPSSY